MSVLNEVVNGSGLAILCVLGVAGLLVWFWVNRASVRANEQIRLLTALLEEQKEQNQLLQRLVAAQAGAEQAAAGGNDEPDFIRVIPER
ncbi:YebO family protein [Erwinia sp. BNK-24-b]|uniref:YebO family protein n=1 Tax=Erwinia TaxID=551 RepID=UPI0039BF4FDB|nr:YebO family protein [Erwinia phyllosphaerae]